MKTVLISILTPVLFLALIFGLVLLFTPVLFSVIPVVWYLKSARKRSVKQQKIHVADFKLASC